MPIDPNHYQRLVQIALTGLFTLLAAFIAVAAKHYFDQRALAKKAEAAELVAEHDLELAYLKLVLECSHYCNDVRRLSRKLVRTIELWRAVDAGLSNEGERLEAALAADVATVVQAKEVLRVACRNYTNWSAHNQGVGHLMIDLEVEIAALSAPNLEAYDKFTTAAALRRDGDSDPPEAKKEG